MREIVLGTAGHVDHGKTSLIRALTGIDTDRLKEEKERGITIELGFAFLDLPCGHRLGVVDVPGHERFVRNMVAGASGIDLVAFVVAADEGIMPQTREHFEICRLLGVRQGLVVITKKDMVDPDWLEMVQEEVREYFAGSFLDHAPMVAVSSVTGEGIDKVVAALDKLVQGSEFVEAFGAFRLPIDRVFSMKGFGAVVTGTSISGRIGSGDDAMLYPRGLPVKIRGIQVHGRDVPVVEAGNRTAINLQGVEKDMVGRGDLLATPGCLEPTYMFDADFLFLSSNKKNLRNRQRVRIHIGTAEVMGRVVLLAEDEIEPDSETNVQLLLEEQVVIWPGDHYVVRSYSPITTIGGGMILNLSLRKRKRFREKNQHDFELFRAGNQEEFILYQLRESGHAGMTFDALAPRIGIFGNRLKKLLDRPISARRILIIDSDKQRMIAAETFQELLGALSATLREYHRENLLRPGMGKEELRTRMARDLDQRLFQFVLNDLLRKGEVVQDEALIRLQDHRVSMSDNIKTLREDIERLYREAAEAGLAVPSHKEVLETFSAFPPQQVNEILDLLERDRVLVRLNRDLYVNSEKLDDLRRKVVEHIKKEGEIDAQGFKNLTGLTRKFSIPLLEYFDRIKLTIRVGDKRVLRG